ncbi:MAG TPA: iron-sulfur cluster assembly accessory protein [Polyangiaceae bacterium]|nr:iron-sulfur cluster assembly accessory protein [Polyangiaceae bacterium]
MAITAESAVTPSIQVTPGALKFIQRMVRFGGAGADAGFRLEVTPGGCSGMSSQFSVEAAPKSGDRVVSLAGGLRLFLPPFSYALLEGVTIDFLESATEARLTFIDPNAKSCGCSSSGPETKLTKLS